MAPVTCPYNCTPGTEHLLLESVAKHYFHELIFKGNHCDSSVNVFGNGLILLLSLFWTLSSGF
jgi:hypothetical protein